MRAVRLFGDHHYPPPPEPESHEPDGSVGSVGPVEGASSGEPRREPAGSVGFDGSPPAADAGNDPVVGGSVGSGGSVTHSAERPDPETGAGSGEEPKADEPGRLVPHPPVFSSRPNPHATTGTPSAAAPHRHQAGEGEDTGGGGGAQDAPGARLTSSDPWEAPTPLEIPAEPLEPFDAALLPAAIRGHVIDLAERSNLLVDHFLPALFTALGGVVGNTWRMFPLAKGDWEVIPALWSLLVARSGSKKTLAGKELFRPIRAIDQRLYEERRAAQPAHDAQVTVLSMQVANLKKALDKAIQNEEPTEALQAQLAEVNRQLDAVSLPTRMILVQDTTTEKLLETQRDNPRGVILARDEIGGFLDALSKPGREGDLQYYLEGWNSAAPFKQSRIGRGHVHAPRNTIAITGNVQPRVLADYRRNVLGRGDGLLQRFQVLVHLDELPPFELVDRPADQSAKATYDRVVDALFALDPKAKGFKEYGELRFDEAAQELFNGWLRALEGRLRDPALQEQSAFHEHLAKYRSLLPAICAIYHLVDVVTTGCDYRVPLNTAQRAIDTVAYLEQHAQRLFRNELDKGTLLADRLLEKLAGLALPDGTITIRDLQRRDWSGLTPTTLPAAIRRLEAHGWVRSETRANPKGGRPSSVLRLHPALRRLYQQAA